MFKTREDRRIAEEDWQGWEEANGPLPHEAQDKLYLDLMAQVEAIDAKMGTASGLDLDVLEFQKNAYTNMLDDLASMNKRETNA